MNKRKFDNGQIETVVRHYSGESTIRKVTADWSTADFDYAIDQTQTNVTAVQRDVLAALFRILRDECDLKEARAIAEEANEKRHKLLSQQLDELKRPLWTVLPNFWVTVISAIAAILAAYFTWLAPKK